MNEFLGAKNPNEAGHIGCADQVEAAAAAVLGQVEI